MAPLLLIARYELRRRWPSLVLIGLLAGIAGAAVLGASALARRAGTAEARLAHATRTDDVRTLVIGGTSDASLAIGQAVLGVPGVGEGRVARGGVARLDGPAVLYVSVMEAPQRWGSDVVSPVLSAGRLPDPTRVDEVVVNEAALADASRVLGIGQQLTLHFLAVDEFARFDATTPLAGTAGTQLVTIVGYVRLIGSGDDLPRVIGTRALADAFPQGMGVLGAALVRLQPGVVVDDFVARVNSVTSPVARPPAIDDFPVVTVTATEQQLGAVTRTSTRVLTAGLLLMALVAAVAGLAAVTQTATRHYAASAAEQRAEAAIGLTTRGRVGARLLAATPIAFGAGLMAGAGGLAVAHLSPPGALRLVEPHPGWAPNWLMIGLGALATPILLLAVLAWRAGRVLRRPRVTPPWQEAPFVTRVARRGGRPSTVLGLSMALQRPPGPRSTSGRAGMVTVALGVAGVLGTMTFASSLHRLVSTPARFGETNDLVIADASRELAETFVGDPRFSAVVTATSADIVIDGHPTAGISQTALSDAVHWELADGRPPVTPDEIVLGTRLADDLGKGVGDAVSVRDAVGVAHDLAVVGVGVLPTYGSGSFGRTAAFTPDGLTRVALETPTGELGLDVAPGVSLDSVVRDFESRYELTRISMPREVSNLRQIDRVPMILGALLAVLATVTAIHTATMIARRARGDLAITRVLGFTTRQSRTSLLVMAAVVSLVGVVVAVPLGLLLGTVIWRLVAEGAAVLGDAVLPWLGVIGLAVSAATVAVVLGLVLAWRERRARLAETLRAVA